MGRSSSLHLVAAALLLLLFGRAALIGFPSSKKSQAVSQPQSESDVASSDINATTLVMGRDSIAYNLYLSYLSDDETGTVDNTTCQYTIASQYNCGEEGCNDLVAGYINYIDFLECTVPNAGARFGAALLLVVWLMFLLHIVETTTNDYFVTSLQLAVAILNLSPNVAGVTFLAVGNAACDVIASVAAFATGVPKVGVGTTLGAGIFVTTACVAAVSFVADVRLARRSFIRDVLFFIITIVYLLFCTLDGIITVAESWGFIIIYFVFLGVVLGGRCLRFLRTEDEHSSVAGVIHGEGGSGKPSESVSTYKAPEQQSAAFIERKNNILNVLEGARKEAMARQHEKEIQTLKNAKYFAQNEEEDEEGGDLGSGSGDLGFTSNAADEDKLLPSTRSGARGRTGSLTQQISEDLPNKPSKWTSAFYATQEDNSGAGGGSSSGGGAAPAYMPFQMPKYHRKKLAKKLAKRLAARGIHHEVVTADGRTVDIAELALTDPDAAADMIAAAAASVTAEAVRHAGAPLTFQAAAEAAAHGAVSMGHDNRPGEGGSSSGGGFSGGGANIPVEDLLAVMSKETIKPVSVMYVRFKRIMDLIGPRYHNFMHTCETPVIIARHLTIPLLHEASYHRRLVLINLPCSLALLTVVMTTHVLKGTATEIGGFPLFVLAAIIGGIAAVGYHKWWLPVKTGRGQDEGVGLLGSSSSGGASSIDGGSLIKDAASSSSSSSSSSGGSGATASGIDHHSGGGASDGHHHGDHWYSNILRTILGPKGDPMPKGAPFSLLLLLSFMMSLVWLLLIANELVGTALCFGKILDVPDIIMGLVVLAVGNSINDLAASVTIAREGFPSMAVAGAYAGPMFNVLAGIGLPMLIYTSRAPNAQYVIGKDTPIVWAAFVTLLTSLTVTLIWVPLAGFRITHRIGRFLLAWFFGFIVLVIIMGSVPGLAGEDDVVLG